MGEYVAVCRICLAHNVRLLPIADVLQFVYEKISSTPLFTEDRRPLTACYICHTLLKKVYQLMLTSAIAEKHLTNLLETNPKLTTKSIALIDRKAIGLAGSLVISPPECIDTPASRNLSAEKTEIKTEKYQEISESSEPEEFEESVQSETPSQTLKLEEKSTNIYKDQALKIKTEELSENEYECEINTKEFNDVESAESEETEQSAQLEKFTPAEENSININNRSRNHTKQKNSKSSSKQLRNIKALKTHVRSHTDKYKCNFCHRSYVTIYNLKRHLVTHSDEKRFKCDYCQYGFNYKNDLIIHIRSHTGEKPYKCNECSQSYRNKSSFKIHLRTHSDEKPYKCDYCVYCSTNLPDLRKHSRRHINDKPYKCNYCDNIYRCKYDLKIHIRTHTGEKPYKCEDCQFSFTTRSALNVHNRTQKHLILSSIPIEII